MLKFIKESEYNKLKDIIEMILKYNDNNLIEIIGLPYYSINEFGMLTDRINILIIYNSEKDISSSIMDCISEYEWKNIKNTNPITINIEYCDDEMPDIVPLWKKGKFN